MSEVRKLNDVAIREDMWAKAADELFREDWETRDQAEFYGYALARAVVKGEMERGYLRGLVDTASALDREAVEISAGDIENLGDGDYIEAVARRIAHQTCRVAYKMAKPAKLGSGYQEVKFLELARRNITVANLGMGWLEAKDRP